MTPLFRELTHLINIIKCESVWITQGKFFASKTNLCDGKVEDVCGCWSGLDHQPVAGALGLELGLASAAVADDCRVHKVGRGEVDSLAKEISRLQKRLKTLMNYKYILLFHQKIMSLKNYEHMKSILSIQLLNQRI